MTTAIKRPHAGICFVLGIAFALVEGCSGGPGNGEPNGSSKAGVTGACPVTVTVPSSGEQVGQYIQISVDQSCASWTNAMVAYIDDVDCSSGAYPNPNPGCHTDGGAQNFSTSTWIQVAPGTHKLVVNNWDASGDVSVSNPQTFTYAAHSNDFASSMPSHLAVMFSMAWFGIPSSDPQGAGPDPSYGNTQWGGGCIATNDPTSCSPCILEGAGDACQLDGASQRATASRRRMLAGPYSASGQTIESLRRIDLMLSQARSSCSAGAKLDTWTLQLNGTHNTPLHPGNPGCTTCGIAYGATRAFLDEADVNGLKNVVMPGDDSTFYFHFGQGVGLGLCDDSAGNPKSSCIDALTQDFVDMATMSAAHPSALRVNGKPVLFAYFDPQYLSPSDWVSVFANARARAGTDFYALGAIQNPWALGYFAAFDGLAPWIQLNWSSYSGSTTREHAYNWAAGMHSALVGTVGSYPGRVVFGGMTPGFDDYTENWGACTERQLPPGDARDPDLLAGEFDYFRSAQVRGLIGETWDDWTEGSEFEPDVAGGPSVLLSLRAELTRLYDECPDPLGSANLAKQWHQFGQARNCDGGSASTSPVTNLNCNYAGGCSTESHFDKTSDDPVGGWNTANIDLLMDVDGDKKDDLVVLWNNGDANAQVSLSTGTAFNYVSNGDVGVWDPSSSTLVTDLDGDGRKDLLRFYQNGTSTFAQVWKSTGTAFTSVWNNWVGGWDPTYVKIAMDVNGDGKGDFLILWNNGGTTYAQVDLSDGTNYNQVSNDSLGEAFATSDRWLSADVNGDGKKDLVRIWKNAGSAFGEVWLSNGTSFGSSTFNDWVGGWSDMWQDLLFDVDGDGKDDLVILWSNGGMETAQVSRSYGWGFTQESNAAMNVPWLAAATNRFFGKDVDGDGKGDLVTVWPNGALSYAQVALSNGTTFLQATNSPVGSWDATWADLAGDVNGDGKSDLVILRQDSSLSGWNARGEVMWSSCTMGVCGDGVCGGYETCNTCKVDCGWTCPRHW
jgi:hypothetical protein